MIICDLCVRTKTINDGYPYKGIPDLNVDLCEVHRKFVSESITKLYGTMRLLMTDGNVAVPTWEAFTPPGSQKLKDIADSL